MSQRAVFISVPFSKVCRYRKKENDLLIEAGNGWHAGVVGNVISRADITSPQGRAFITGKPSICNDLRDDNDFKLPPFYAEHGIVSTIDVVIKGRDDQPYGVLEIDITNSMITTSTTSNSSPVLPMFLRRLSRHPRAPVYCRVPSIG